ncbi:negative elongation factor E-like [Pleurodeles waltl]|uniref:negative elongation factor E-like n=1 Tax=Pleurodeles waltl TaxID=8319 RepID=UPI003709A800
MRQRKRQKKARMQKKTQRETAPGILTETRLTVAVRESEIGTEKETMGTVPTEVTENGTEVRGTESGTEGTGIETEISECSGGGAAPMDPVPSRRINGHGSDSFPDRRAPRKGNTVYVHGAGMTKTMLRGAFANYGNIIDLATDSVRNCAFVTFEKMESADQAIAELNGTKVEDVLMKVSIAHKQPMLEAATGNSVWGSLSVQNSSKGSHRDKRSQVVYNEDLF